MGDNHSKRQQLRPKMRPAQISFTQASSKGGPFHASSKHQAHRDNSVAVAFCLFTVRNKPQAMHGSLRKKRKEDFSSYAVGTPSPLPSHSFFPLMLCLPLAYSPFHPLPSLFLGTLRHYSVSYSSLGSSCDTTLTFKGPQRCWLGL